jgi:hypothetical protein
MTDHVGLHVIAALDEGLLDVREAEHARLHLLDCPACAAREAALAQVPAALSRLAQAEPPPIPADIAARLDAALAAEVEAARAASPDTASPDHAAVPDAPDRAVPDRAAVPDAPDHVPSIAEAPGRRRRRPGVLAPRPLAAAAAVCLLAGGGYALFRAEAPSSGPGSSVAAAPHQAASATRPAKRSGPLLEPGVPASGASSPPVTHSATNYQPGQLQAQVESVLRQNAGRSYHVPAGPAAATATPLPAGLEGCLQRITGGRQPTLVDEARYAGQPATVIVAPRPAGSGGQVWVAGPGCSAANGDVLAQTAISSIP